MDSEYALMNDTGNFIKITTYTGKHCRIIKDEFNLLYNGIIFEAGKVLFRNYVCILNFQVYEY